MTYSDQPHNNLEKTNYLLPGIIISQIATLMLDTLSELSSVQFIYYNIKLYTFCFNWIGYTRNAFSNSNWSSWWIVYDSGKVCLIEKKTSIFHIKWIIICCIMFSPVLHKARQGCLLKCKVRLNIAKDFKEYVNKKI